MYRILVNIDNQTHDLYFIYDENIIEDVDNIFESCYTDAEAIDCFESGDILLAHIIYPDIKQSWELGF